MKFRVYFNDNKQYVIFHLADDVKAFRRKNQCWAYYIAADERRTRRGLFGHIHLPHEKFVNMSELISHEVQHLMIDWVLCRKDGKLTPRNEERIATITGEIVKRFWREYERLGV
jgi:hypothetical protein